MCGNGMAEHRWQRLWLVVLRTQTHCTSLMAAGCAFYATLAVFPALSMLVSLYGLMFDPRAVEEQMSLLRELLPPDAFTLIGRAVHALVERPRQTLGVNLLIAAGITLWSASTGTKSMLTALNIAYEEEERRGVLRFEATGLAMTLAAIAAAVVTLVFLVALPAVVAWVPLPTGGAVLVQAGSFALMMLFIFAGLWALYRFGPSRSPGRVRRVAPGCLVASVAWLGLSALFSLYVTDIASFGTTYGPLAAIAAMMLWFWVSAYVVLVGAELNSALETWTKKRAEGSVAEGVGRPGP